MTTIKEKREEIKQIKRQIQQLEAKIRILRMEVSADIRGCDHKWERFYSDYGEIYFKCSECNEERERVYSG